MDPGSGVGAGGGMPPPHQQIPDAVGLAAGRDVHFFLMRSSFREKIFDYIGRMQILFDWRSRLPELARRLEEILFRKFPNKNDYYSMMRGPIEPHLQYAIKFLHAPNAQHQRNLEMSREIATSPGHRTTAPTPGIMQGTSENSGMSYVTHYTGAFKPIADCVPWNANTGEAPDEHVNTVLTLGMNSSHHRSRLSNYNPVINMTPSAPVKEVPKEPKFSCPVCMNELVDASSTICGHIFCQHCIRASIVAQSKCPTCRRTLSQSDFHRVYLPTMD